MKNCLSILIIIIITLMPMSCKTADTPDDLIGTWVKIGNEENVTIFPDGDFIERNCFGECAVGPTIYQNYEGKWHKLSDSRLEINVDHWSGSTYFQIEIISLNSKELKISYHYTN